MKQNSSKQIIIPVLGVALLLIAVVGISYAAFNYSRAGTTINTITTGSIIMNYSESENGITIVNALPTSDSTGMTLNGEDYTFDFHISATVKSGTTLNYIITAVKDEGSTIDDDKVKVYLTSADDTIVEKAATKISELGTTSSDASGAPDGQYKLKEGTITKTETTNYRLRMWLASDSGITAPGPGEMPKTYRLSVNVYGHADVQ